MFTGLPESKAGRNDGHDTHTGYGPLDMLHTPLVGLTRHPSGEWNPYQPDEGDVKAASLSAAHHSPQANVTRPAASTESAPRSDRERSRFAPSHRPAGRVSPGGSR